MIARPDPNSHDPNSANMDYAGILAQGFDIDGTAFDDAGGTALIGTSVTDRIRGFAGSDELEGRDGVDVIAGTNQARCEARLPQCSRRKERFGGIKIQLKKTSYIPPPNSLLFPSALITDYHAEAA